METLKLVLYIEDDPGSALLVRKLLEAEGMRVAIATDGISGLETAMEIRPDLVLMDINIPNLEGQDVAVRMKAEPELSDVPIVAVTAHGGEENKTRFLSLGCDGFIAKPLDPDSFTSMVMEYMQGSRKDTVETDKALEELRSYTFSLANRLEARVRELMEANSRLEKANELKSRFIDKVTHELSSPLTPILGYSRILEMEQAGKLNELQKKCVKSLRISANRMRRLVNSLLEVSYLESGRFVPRRDRLDPADLFREAAKEFVELAGEKEIRIEFDIEEDLFFEGDRDQLISILGNILHNALKASPRGADILLFAGSHDNGVELSVLDQGPGIPGNELEKVFRDFYQIRSRDISEREGAGLGLAIARRVVEAHGGSIWAESPPCDESGKKAGYAGTSIIISLPLPE
ncbi:MAG: hybrid sensor histidine kinase/response regulator [Deltaproteobacteria bacterium]|nr:hybrid sensor histidine kinase/response regulator [Deltaproteobacteria bacterium]